MSQKHLIIAGHGAKRDGTYDPGASGFITQGEHKYVSQKFFKAMKKYASSNFIFHDSYNVYDRGNIVALAKAYGINTTVTEIHFDASSNDNARGGHVIVFSQYKPDAMDLRIRDAIDKVIGLRLVYHHHKELGIAGRHGLANINRTAAGGVNYRLVELGFGTNRKDADIMLNNTDEYAKEMVKAISGNNAVKPKPTPSLKPKPAQSSEQVAQAIAKGLGGWGNYPERAKNLTEAGYNADAVQRRVNDILKAVVKPKPVPKPVKKSVEQVAQEIHAGKGGWGNNPERASKLRAQGYDATQVQSRVNQLSKGTPKSGRLAQVTIDSIARQVLRGVDDTGKRIPNGRDARARHFGITSGDIDRVQTVVNKS